jgi:hypothetical protein
MGPRWLHRAALVAAMGAILLAVTVWPSLAYPDSGVDIMDQPERASVPSGDGPIGAQAAPALEILAPSESSRPDFARDELGDEWDMQNSNDVDYMDHVNNSNFGPGGWYGEVTQGTVANIALFAPGGPGNPAGLNSIDTSKYYRFSYDLYVPGANPGDGTNHRIIYLTQWPFQPSTQHCSGALTYPSYDSWHTYQYDLRSVPLDGSACGNWNWNGHNVAALLIWPHEQWNSPSSGRGPAFFRYRNISLTGDNQADASYDIRWCVADSDGDAVTTTLYYDTDTNWDNGKVEIASVVTQPTIAGPYKIYLPIIFGQGNGGGSGLACSIAGGKLVTYTWNTSGLPDGGAYYIWFEATDGTTTVSDVSTSTAPIHIDH